MQPSIALYSPSLSRSDSKMILFFSHTNFAVEGISCISPTAPASLTAFSEKPLSALITEKTSEGSSAYFWTVLRHGRRKESAKAVKISAKNKSPPAVIHPTFFILSVIKIQYERNRINFPVFINIRWYSDTYGLLFECYNKSCFEKQQPQCVRDQIKI